MLVISGPTRYQLDHKGSHPFSRTRVINTVQSRAYSRSGFSAISLNYINVTYYYYFYFIHCFIFTEININKVIIIIIIIIIIITITTL